MRPPDDELDWDSLGLGRMNGQEEQEHRPVLSPAQMREPATASRLTFGRSERSDKKDKSADTTLDGFAGGCRTGEMSGSISSPPFASKRKTARRRSL
jgi:hypothetical protein